MKHIEALRGLGRIGFCVMALVLLSAMGSHATAASGMTWVENGEVRAPIVVFAGAPPKTVRAAHELADYVERMTGLRPAVVEGAPDPLPSAAVWVGWQPAVSAVFPSIDFEFREPEEVLIAAAGGHLVVAGRDIWDEEHLNVEGRNFLIEGQQQEYGTINAVYTLLQDFMGVRWFWPGELGEDVPEVDVIAFEPFEYRYSPPIRIRNSMFRLSAPGDSRGHSHQWSRMQRLQLDSLKPPTRGHAFTDWWERFSEEHPDYFALQPDGTRSGFPGPRTVKVCQSNPALWEQWFEDVAAAIASDPRQTVFSASPNDSWHRGHCICENCLAWDNPNGEMVRLAWQGLSQEYVSLSDRQVRFANTLARMMKERYPDNPEFMVYMHAYGGAYTLPPVAEFPDDNVAISGVHNFIMRGEEMFKTMSERYRGWGEVTKNLMWRPNIAQGFNRRGLPLSASQAIECFEILNEVGCQGLYFDTIWEHWATHAPAYYVMARMAWDPSIDGKAVLDDYYQRAFGPAAASVAAYFQLAEDTFHEFFNAPQGTLEQDVYSKDFFAQCEALLSAAAAAVPDGSVYAARVAFIRAGLEHSRLLVDNMRLMERYRASGEREQEALSALKANWNAIADIYEAYPIAFNIGFMVGGSSNLVPDQETAEMLRRVRFGRPRN